MPKPHQGIARQDKTSAYPLKAERAASRIPGARENWPSGASGGRPRNLPGPRKKKKKKKESPGPNGKGPAGHRSSNAGRGQKSPPQTARKPSTPRLIAPPNWGDKATSHLPPKRQSPFPSRVPLVILKLVLFGSIFPIPPKYRTAGMLLRKIPPDHNSKPPAVGPQSRRKKNRTP